MTLTPTQRQQRWRSRKRKAEIASGVRKRRKRPKSAAEIKRSYRARLKREVEEAKYAASRERRALSRAAPAIAPDFRAGDCREVLLDIAAESVALVLTDPEYGKSGEALYRWLADFALRVLVPGGSLLCYTGQTTWHRDANIFAVHLQPRPLLFMLLDQEPRMRGGETIRGGLRPVLWFTKGRRRRRETRPYLCEVPTLARSSGKDKSLHPWQQGDAVRQWIEPLTDPGELIVDPFYGSGEWGHICAAMGRKWIGSNI